MPGGKVDLVGSIECHNIVFLGGASVETEEENEC